MSKFDDGGAAFAAPGFSPPYHPEGGWDVHAETAYASQPQQGMTLLDYFAGHAMNGLIAMSADGPHDRGICARVAKMAYAQAEEMLKRRRELLAVGLLDQPGPDAPPPPPPPPPPTHWQPGMNFGPPDPPFPDLLPPG